jgi:hypothetical protein
MLWSMRHKQRLTRMPAIDKEGYHGSWAKFDGLLEMANDESCKWIVYLDTDVCESFITENVEMIG